MSRFQVFKVDLVLRGAGGSDGRSVIVMESEGSNDIDWSMLWQLIVQACPTELLYSFSNHRIERSS